MAKVTPPDTVAPVLPNGSVDHGILFAALAKGVEPEAAIEAAMQPSPEPDQAPTQIKDIPNG